jgi:hypothetical protein
MHGRVSTAIPCAAPIGLGARLREGSGGQVRLALRGGGAAGLPLELPRGGGGGGGGGGGRGVRARAGGAEGDAREGELDGEVGEEGADGAGEQGGGGGALRLGAGAGVLLAAEAAARGGDGVLDGGMGALHALHLVGEDADLPGLLGEALGGGAQLDLERGGAHPLLQRRCRRVFHGCWAVVGFLARSGGAAR